MILIISGSSRTGKTILAQRLMEKCGVPCFSIDHLSKGLVRCGYTDLKLGDHDGLKAYVWPIVREMIKTAIENGQNLIVEGCYVPYDWREGLEERYQEQIRFAALTMSEEYIASHFSEILRHGSDLEKRDDDAACSAEILQNCNRNHTAGFQERGERVFVIREEYEETLAEILEVLSKEISAF